MDGVNWFLGGVIGLLAGVIAERLLNRRFSIFGKLVGGVAGAILIVAAADLMQIALPAGVVTTMVVSLLGATLLLGVLSLFRKPR